jgi:hypothetical protein
VLALAAALALTGPAAASAAGPAVPIPGAGNGELAQAVNAGGDGVIAYRVGSGVETAAVTPTGQLGPSVPIAGPRCVGGPFDLNVAISDAGQIVATWTCFIGQQPSCGSHGNGAYGFVRRPVYARWQWGATPGRGAQLAGGRIDTFFPKLAMEPDGTAALLFGEAGFPPHGSCDLGQMRLAVIPPAGPPRLRLLDTARNGQLNPSGLAVDGAGRLVAAWGAAGTDRGVGLRIAKLSAAGTGGRPRRFPALDPQSGALFVDAAGDETLVDVHAASGSRQELRVSARAADASRFGRPRVIAAGTMVVYLAGAVDGAGTTLLVYAVDGAGLAIERAVDGSLTAPGKLPASATFGFSGTDFAATITAGGDATLDFTARTRSAFRLETEIWPHGGVLGPPLTLGAACDTPVLAAAATGAQLLTGTCEQGNGNSVVTLFPGATLG